MLFWKGKMLPKLSYTCQAQCRSLMCMTGLNNHVWLSVLSLAASRKVCCGSMSKSLITFCPWGFMWRENHAIFFNFELCDSVATRQQCWESSERTGKTVQLWGGEGEQEEAERVLFGIILGSSLSRLWSEGENFSTGCRFGSGWEHYWSCLENNFG